MSLAEGRRAFLVQAAAVSSLVPLIIFISSVKEFSDILTNFFEIWEI